MPLFCDPEHASTFRQRRHILIQTLDLLTTALESELAGRTAPSTRHGRQIQADRRYVMTVLQTYPESDLLPPEGSRLKK